MVFSATHAGIFIATGFGIWLVLLTYFFIRQRQHYQRLTSRGGKNLQEILEQVLQSEIAVQKHLAEVARRIARLEEDGTFHIQRVGIVRFNPFADTGGAQSFTLALLDKANDGIVMTSLYGRTANRWYVKEVVGGKGKHLELSKEEEAAIGQASKVKRSQHE